MRVHFPCPKCGKHLKADATLVGKRGSCSRCGERFEVPTTPPSPPPVIPEEQASIVDPMVASDAEVKLTAPAPSSPADAIQDDNSAGIASMYLGAVNLALFLASNLLGSGLLALLGLFFGLAMNLAVCLVCLIVAAIGWRLAQEAKVQAAMQHGRGRAYATAGLTVHGLFALLNVALAVGLVAGFILGPNRAGTPAIQGMPDVGNILKPFLDMQKEQQKFLEGLK
jgi:hypothetical protein